MKHKLNWIIITIIVVVLIVVFFPKPYIKGGLGGFIGLGESVYREEFSCLGFEHSYYPKGCFDCGTIHNCYGIPYGKKCYIETASKNDSTITTILTVCK